MIVETPELLARVRACRVCLLGPRPVLRASSFSAVC